jgi:hypothetical protein
MGSVSMSHHRLYHDVICNNIVFVIFVRKWEVYYYNRYCICYFGTYMFWCIGVGTDWFVIFLKYGFVIYNSQYNFTQCMVLVDIYVEVVFP